MNKKYLLLMIGVLVVIVAILGGYIVGNKPHNQTKTEKSVQSSSSKIEKSSSSSVATSSSSTTSTVISTTDAETQLNNGQSIDGKIVDIDILEVENDTALGQNIQAGEHLNFYPATQQYNLKTGGHVKFKVTAAKSTMGSWLIKGNVIN